MAEARVPIANAVVVKMEINELQRRMLSEAIAFRIAQLERAKKASGQPLVADAYSVSIDEYRRLALVVTGYAPC